MLPSLVHFLASDKAPYIVTLFVAAVAWTSVRTADRLSGTPFVEYRITDQRSDAGRTLEIRVRNITQSAMFPCFQLMVASPDSRSLTLLPSDQWDQVIRGTVLVLGSPKRAVHDEAVIEIQNLYPGGDFAVKLPVKGAGDPRLLAKGCAPMPAAPSDSGADANKSKALGLSPAPPILIPLSARTFFVEWEMTILWATLVLWGVLMLVVQLAKANPPAPIVVDLLETKHDSQGSID
jgi:hypothetical protein